MTQFGDGAGDETVDPVEHGGGDVGGDLEDGPHNRQEDEYTQYPMGDEPVNFIGEGQIVAVFLRHLAYQVVDEGVAAVGDEDVDIFAVGFLQASIAELGLGEQGRSAFDVQYSVLDAGVLFQ